MHKNPLKTRSIILISGSYLQGLSVWLDNQLKPIIKKLRSYIDSSRSFKYSLPLTVDQRALLFTADATSMYTNIDTDHALKIIEEFLKEHPLCEDIDWKPIIRSLKLIMRENIFQFSDKFFLQLIGTAMGTNTAPSYATLYFGIKEILTYHKYNNIQFVKRFLDDIFGIWVCSLNKELDNQLWTQFQTDINNFGILKWVFEKRKKSVQFLDLTVSINQKGKLVSDIFEKPENLYLYLPPLSSHPSNCIKGTIFGMIRRYWWLIDDNKKRIQSVNLFYKRLLRRGYVESFLTPIFNNGIQKAKLDTTNNSIDNTIDTDDNNNMESAVFLHLKYNPADPPSQDIQKIFKETMLNENQDCKSLPNILNSTGVQMGIDKLVVAYSKQKNIKNLVSPRQFDKTEGPKVSEYLALENFDSLYPKKSNL